MTSAPFEYWKPGNDEERQLRIFISHRYGKDDGIYAGVVNALYRNGFPAQDISLNASRMISGPRGGALPEMEIQAEIAARIYTSDVLIAPSISGVSRSEWVTWEVQLAAIGYGIPVLFVNQKNQKRTTSLLKQIQDLGLPCAACEPQTHEIARSVAELVVQARPTWAVRQEETDGNLKFRGPPSAARTKIMRTFPFQPRLGATEPAPPPVKRGFWSRIAGGDQHT
jgi:hypothetical protein